MNQKGKRRVIPVDATENVKREVLRQDHISTLTANIIDEGRIDFRWTPNSRNGQKRAILLSKACDEYNLTPSTRLLDRLLKDLDQLIQYRLRIAQEKLDREKILKGLE